MQRQPAVVTCSIKSADVINFDPLVGFTKYEAKAYVALLGLGPATGYQVAKESGVPRSMVYEILNKLIARGAVATQSLAEVGHGVALITDGSGSLIGEVDRSESAAWTTNGFAVALALWCLKCEMAGLSESRPPHPSRASRPKRKSAR